MHVNEKMLFFNEFLNQLLRIPFFYLFLEQFFGGVNLSLSLYIGALCPLASASEKELPPVQDILMSILKKFPKSPHLRQLVWDEAPRKRIKVTLGVPFISRLYQIRKKDFLKAKYDSVSVIFSTFSRREGQIITSKLNLKMKETSK